MFDDDLNIIQTPRIKHLWDVTNFIDVMIVLLIFLIGTTTFTKAGISLNQPASTTASAVPPKVLEMDMNAEGVIFFELKPIEEDQVKHMVMRLLMLTRPPQADAADALAIAICHRHMHSGLLARAASQVGSTR